MKIKKILLVMGVFLSGLLIGCTTTSSGATDYFNMDYLGSDLVNWVGDFYLYEDTQTHVEYIVYMNDGNVAITPRLKASGQPYLNE